MKVIGLTEFGGPDVLRALDVPEPHAGPGEIRVRVQAAAVNPVDTIIRSGGFAGKDGDITDPVVPGTDIAGVVDEVGEHSATDEGLAVGDHVIGFVVPDGSHGGYSEFVVLPAESVTRLPGDLSVVEGASFLSNALTAAMTLEHLALNPGSTLAVTGATGAVGGYLVELAARQGVTVIALASAGEGELVRGFGATHVIERGHDFAAGVRALTNGLGADALADPAIVGDSVFEAVRDGGQAAFYLPTESAPGRDVRVFGSYVMRSNRRHDAISSLAQMADRGEIATRVADTLPAAEASTAHARLEQGGLRGRLILEF